MPATTGNASKSNNNQPNRDILKSIADSQLGDKEKAPLRGLDVIGDNEPSARVSRQNAQLEAVIQIELDRMRRHPQACDLALFEIDVAVDHIVRENATSG